MPIAYTSREALRKMADNLGPLQLRIWEAIRDWPHRDIGPSTEELAEKLGIKVSTVCGRISELREAGAIEDAPLKFAASGRRVKSYRALVWREPRPRGAEQLTLSIE